MKYKKFLILLIVSFFLLLFCVWTIPCYKNGLFEVEKGESLFQISHNLKKQGFIQMEFPFYTYILLKGEVNVLKYGVYQFTSDDTFMDIAQKIIQGETYTIKVTIPEGYNIKQIDNRLAEAGLIENGNLIDFDIENFQFSNLEGFLFPDTYFFYPQRDTEKIVKIFLDNFDRKLTSELRQEIQNQNKTIFEIITMASLIEKEVRTTEDKKLVSGILWKRLENNIPLQVCATIVYITGKKTTKVSIVETEIDSPYNTYKYRGLPIGPICNPGLDSIIAAMYPEHSEYWYHLSTPEGETIFSKTPEEHSINKAKYLRSGK